MLTWDDLTEEEKEDIISQTGEDEEFFEYYVSEFLTEDEVINILREEGYVPEEGQLWKDIIDDLLESNVLWVVDLRKTKYYYFYPL